MIVSSVWCNTGSLVSNQHQTHILADMAISVVRCCFKRDWQMCSRKSTIFIFRSCLYVYMYYIEVWKSLCSSWKWLKRFSSIYFKAFGMAKQIGFTICSLLCKDHIHFTDNSYVGLRNAILIPLLQATVCRASYSYWMAIVTYRLTPSFRRYCLPGLYFNRYPG